VKSKPLYSKIYETLKERIENRDYLPGEQLPTESELTVMFQVSRITVKRALDDLEQQGYIYRIKGSGSYVNGPGGSGSAARLMQRMIAFILPSEGASGIGGYVSGASKELESRGYYLSIHTTNESPAKERELLESLPKNGIQGIIFYPINGRTNLDAVYTLYMNGFPIVTIDKYYEGIPVGSVVADNQAGGYMAASRLAQLGHSRIAFVSSVSLDSATSVKNRYIGYCRALKDHGLLLDPELVVLDYIEELGRMGEQPFYEQLVHRLMRLKVTAVQAENDHVAIKLLLAAASLDLKVPEQLSIVGFDNNELAEHVDIPLTTVEQQFKEIGRKAAELIVHALETGQYPDARHEIPVLWKERASTGKPPRSHAVWNADV
jgi:DNA-binding LacI/PurR family transcriptional regulator